MQKLKSTRKITKADLEKSRKAMRKHGCPFCPSKFVYMIDRQEKFTFRGIEVTFDAKLYKCNNCQKEFDDTTTGDYTLNEIRKEYNKKINDRKEK